MILLQMTGLSGAGKTTLAYQAKQVLEKKGFRVEVIDGDVYRAKIGKDLGFSAADRQENIRRLGFIGLTLARHGVITILAAINPFENVRRELCEDSDSVKTVWINCDLETLRQRDTKGLYRRAYLPDDDPQKLTNLTGVNDTFEIPANADLIIETNAESEIESVTKLVNFILECVKSDYKNRPRAMFIGRWQPFHNGHKWLFEQKLEQGIPILIAIRDVPPDENNPLTAAQTLAILEKMYQTEDVEIIIIPDIESVNYGRGVGYAINEFVPPAEIGTISATEIRRQIRTGATDWKKNVDEKIHDLVVEFLS